MVKTIVLFFVLILVSLNIGFAEEGNPQIIIKVDKIIYKQEESITIRWTMPDLDRKYSFIYDVTISEDGEVIEKIPAFNNVHIFQFSYRGSYTVRVIAESTDGKTSLTSKGRHILIL